MLHDQAILQGFSGGRHLNIEAGIYSRHLVHPKKVDIQLNNLIKHIDK